MWTEWDSVAVGLLSLAVALGGCWSGTDADDHYFARGMSFPAPASVAFAPMANFMAHEALGERDPRADAIPAVTKVLLRGLGSTEVGRAAPLEVLPAAVAAVELVAALTFWIVSPRGWLRVAASVAAVAAMVCAPPERGVVHALVVFAFAAMRRAHVSPLSYFAAGALLVAVALSDALLAPLLVPWLLSGYRCSAPVAMRMAWLVTLWQLAEAIGRADPRTAAFHLDATDPARYVATATAAWEAAVGTSLWSNAPHFGNSWQMYQLLFPRFHRGTRIVAALLSLIPPCATAIATHGRGVCTADSARGIAAVAVLSSAVFGNFMHPTHVLLAFAIAPEVSLRIRFGFFVLGAFIVLWPLLLAYRVAWLELGSMPQPNMPFYGGSFFAFTVALYIGQLVARLVVEARVRIARLEAAEPVAPGCAR
uniref:DUF2029 domain-containing protein n=1 Tax=Neobodo designis TaxID=312471 RepID=A0A7S1M4C4_NEODS|mmetsp:Transcript_34063/g.105205  ORF Transcript_34063/g.105205 Transcript_34063/m.105205 type:complete len:423 (+) Transcript_34063:30-1298(+)